MNEQEVRCLSGRIKMMIDAIIEKRCNGDELLKQMTVTKMILKGIDPGQYTASSPDNPEVIQKLNGLAEEMGIRI